jgi:hypothetical protein
VGCSGQAEILMDSPDTQHAVVAQLVHTALLSATATSSQSRRPGSTWWGNSSAATTLRSLTYGCHESSPGRRNSFVVQKSRSRRRGVSESQELVMAGTGG